MPAATTATAAAGDLDDMDDALFASLGRPKLPSTVAKTKSPPKAADDDDGDWNVNDRRAVAPPATIPKTTVVREEIFTFPWTLTIHCPSPSPRTRQGQPPAPPRTTTMTTATTCSPSWTARPKPHPC